MKYTTSWENVQNYLNITARTRIVQHNIDRIRDKTTQKGKQKY